MPPDEGSGRQEGTAGGDLLTADFLATAATAVRGNVEVPGSKSETNRALVLSALASGPSILTGALKSRDCTLMVDALRALGTVIEELSPGKLHITPPEQFHGAPDGINCGLAGTVMRFVPPMAALAATPTLFFGDPQATTRPMSGLLDGLRQLGARIETDSLPFVLSPGPLVSNPEVTVDSSASSQFLSGLLLVGARLPSGLRLRHIGESVPSRPHIEMTVAMLRSRGVIVDEDETNAFSWRVHAGPIMPLDLRIEPDLTNAAVFLAAGATTGGSVTVSGWPESTLQPGEQFLNVVERMGCTTARGPEGVTVTGPNRLQAIDIDLHSASELTPVVAALAAQAEGTTRIMGVAHIRGHETDRLTALRTELQKMDVAVIEHDDGLEIVGRPEARTPVALSSYADHRMVHFAAIIALTRPGTTVDDVSCVSKTMPDFPKLWNCLVAA